MKFFQKTLIASYIFLIVVGLSNLSAMEIEPKSNKRTLEQSQATDSLQDILIKAMGNKRRKTPEKRFVILGQDGEIVGSAPTDDTLLSLDSESMYDASSSSSSNDIQEPAPYPLLEFPLQLATTIIPTPDPTPAETPDPTAEPTADPIPDPTLEPILDREPAPTPAEIPTLIATDIATPTIDPLPNLNEVQNQQEPALISATQQPRRKFTLRTRQQKAAEPKMQASKTGSFIQTIKNNPKSTAGLIGLGLGLFGLAHVTSSAPVATIAGGSGILSSLSGVVTTGYRYLYPTPTEIEVLEKNIQQLVLEGSGLANELDTLIAQGRTSLINNAHSVQCMHNIMPSDGKNPLNALEAGANIQSLFQKQADENRQCIMFLFLVNKKRLELATNQIALLDLNHKRNCLLKNRELSEATISPDQHKAVFAALTQLTAEYDGDKKNLLAEYNEVFKRFIEAQQVCNQALDDAIQL